MSASTVNNPHHVSGYQPAGPNQEFLMRPSKNSRERALYESSRVAGTTTKNHSIPFQAKASEGEKQHRGWLFGSWREKRDVSTSKKPHTLDPSLISLPIHSDGIPRMKGYTPPLGQAPKRPVRPQDSGLDEFYPQPKTQARPQSTHTQQRHGVHRPETMRQSANYGRTNEALSSNPPDLPLLERYLKLIPDDKGSNHRTQQRDSYDSFSNMSSKAMCGDASPAELDATESQRPSELEATESGKSSDYQSFPTFEAAMPAPPEIKRKPVSSTRQPPPSNRPARAAPAVATKPSNSNYPSHPNSAVPLLLLNGVPFPADENFIKAPPRMKRKSKTQPQPSTGPELSTANAWRSEAEKWRKQALREQRMTDEILNQFVPLQAAFRLFCERNPEDSAKINPETFEGFAETLCRVLDDRDRLAKRWKSVKSILVTDKWRDSESGETTSDRSDIE